MLALEREQAAYFEEELLEVGDGFRDLLERHGDAICVDASGRITQNLRAPRYKVGRLLLFLTDEEAGELTEHIPVRMVAKEPVLENLVELDVGELHFVLPYKMSQASRSSCYLPRPITELGLVGKLLGYLSDYDIDPVQSEADGRDFYRLYDDALRQAMNYVIERNLSALPQA